MLSLFGLLACPFILFSFLHQPTQAADPPTSERKITWKWSQTAVFSGDAIISWKRAGSCKRKGTDYYTVSDYPVVKVQGRVTNGVSTGDTLDPKSLKAVLDSKQGSTIFTCDARAKVTFDVIKGDTIKGAQQKFTFSLDHICVDANCKESDEPELRCLSGPKGFLVFYKGSSFGACETTY